MPPDSPELFPLRQQIAMLAAGVGEVTDARQQLTALLRDASAMHGPRSSAAAEIEALLAHLGRLGDGAGERDPR
ncbi:hypothetical protein D7223_13260 [Micromonospora endolithica]|uniref:Uncharacterized protein n=1 Tax=Micromonospora endolithica TaxID=230091 RepID=A0A3A9ZHW7_9ACTN|nr:hypothetical protein D7223_13260 [Micromonospora endolithica]